MIRNAINSRRADLAKKNEKVGVSHHKRLDLCTNDDNKNLTHSLNTNAPNCNSHHTLTVHKLFFPTTPLRRWKRAVVAMDPRVLADEPTGYGASIYLGPTINALTALTEPPSPAVPADKKLKTNAGDNETLNCRLQQHLSFRGKKREHTQTHPDTHVVTTSHVTSKVGENQQPTESTCS